jgi:hypothetical protein
MQTRAFERASLDPGEDLCLFVYGRSRSMVHAALKQSTDKRCSGITNGCGGDTGACFKPRFPKMQNGQF